MLTLKLYTVTGHPKYGAAMVCVIARTSHQAEALAREGVSPMAGINWNSPTCHGPYGGKRKKPGVLERVEYVE